MDDPRASRRLPAGLRRPRLLGDTTARQVAAAGAPELPSLKLARLHMPPGAWWNVGRLAEEDPSIVEVWI